MYREKEIHLTIKDDGIGQKNILPNFGLINMKERVTEHGGHLQSKVWKGKALEFISPFHFNR